MIRRPPRSTRTDTLFPSRRSSDLDCLLVVEAKAGTMPMHSPATNFKAHERAIQDLVVKAYRQCRRFIEYLDSAAEVPIYRLADGVYTEIGRLKRADYRSILDRKSTRLNSSH